MIYATHHSDLNNVTSKADVDKRFGETWEAQVKAGDERAKKLDGVIRVIQKKVPSDSAIETQKIIDATKKFQ